MCLTTSPVLNLRTYHLRFLATRVRDIYNRPLPNGREDQPLPRRCELESFFREIHVSRRVHGENEGLAVEFVATRVHTAPPSPAEVLRIARGYPSMRLGAR